MHRKKPFSGKQKKQQLKDKKIRKKDGPNYLVDDSDDDNKTRKPHHADKDEVKAAGATGFADQLQLLKVHEQPRKGDTSKLDSNSFRLHFLKESDEVVNKRKKEARNPIVPVDEKHLEYRVEDVFPPDAKLDFPKRPPWNYTLSREQLEQQEREYFKKYVSHILDQTRARDLSYFEVNLETWRQLWRVLEISDILLIIADIRYPVIHIPPSLVTYILKELHKAVVIILNKVDFAPPMLALSWKHYLQDMFPEIHVVFFSSYPRQTSPEDDAVNFDPSAALYKRHFRGKHIVAVGPSQLFAVIKEIVQNKVDLSSWEKKIYLDQAPSQEEESSQSDGDQVSHDFTDESTYTKYKDGVVTIGCIGFPNVGKSSVLNALIGKKVVSVSKTPGHTKHLQTIFLSPTVRLCDCPGLVFPSMVPRALQVIGGIFPVAQVKEPYSVVRYLAERLDVPRLLKLTPPDSESYDKRHIYRWSAFDICEAWAIKNGFTTSKAGRPDTYRAANKILRLAAEGQLCLCFRPPHFSENSEKLLNDPEASLLVSLLNRRSQRNISNYLEQQEEGSNDEDEDGSGEDEEEEEREEEERVARRPGMFTKLLELGVDEEPP